MLLFKPFRVTPPWEKEELITWESQERSQGQESNQGACCEVTVPTTEPPYCPIVFYVSVLYCQMWKMEDETRKT